MFKLLTALALTALLAACGTMQTAKDSNPRILGPYKVEGTGKTIDEAKSDAFKKAIEQAVGVAVMSERSVKNKELVKQYVLTHSSGYVERYGILEKRMVGLQHKLLVEVYVRTGTMVDDYALYRSKDAANIDGDRAVATHKTRQISIESGNEMLKAVLADWPEKAYDIDVFPIEVVDGTDGNPWVIVSYDIKYSNKFLKALSNVLIQVKDAGCTWYCPGEQFKISYFDNPDDFVITHKMFSFPDDSTINLIRRALYKGDGKRRFFTKIDFKSNNDEILATYCGSPFGSQSPSDIRWITNLHSWKRTNWDVLQRTQIEPNTFKYYVGKDTRFLSLLNKVEITAVEECYVKKFAR